MSKWTEICKLKDNNEDYVLISRSGNFVFPHYRKKKIKKWQLIGQDVGDRGNKVIDLL